MSSTNEPTDLQFDRADFADGAAAAAPACAVCQRPIRHTYFEVNGQMACFSCRDAIVLGHGRSAGMLGLLKALGAGLAAGVAGALLYYAVLALTGYELGLIAVAVGFMVGGAVRWGSGGRGGRAYQVMAVAITYVAIVSTYVPFIFAGAAESSKTPTNASAPATTSTTAASTPSTAATTANNPEASKAADSSASASAQPTPSTPSTPSAQATPSAQPTQPAAAAAPATEASDEKPLTPGQLVVVFLILAGLILAAPFLAGFGNVIGWLIIGFALFEAWKANRPVSLDVTGPFRIGAAAPTPADAPPQASAV